MTKLSLPGHLHVIGKLAKLALRSLGNGTPGGFVQRAHGADARFRPPSPQSRFEAA
jgi:hypothetical protein